MRFPASFHAPGFLLGIFFFACGGSSSPSAQHSHKLSGIGDSIMQGFDADCSSSSCPTAQPQFSFAQGTSSSIDSLYLRYEAASGLSGGEEFVSAVGANMIGNSSVPPSGLAQAEQICSMSIKPDRIVILLGANDICDSPSAATLPTADDFRNALRSLLTLLGQPSCGLASGSKIHVLSVPRVDLLVAAGMRLDASYCQFVWRNPVIPICPVVTSSAAAASDIDQVGTRIIEFNEGIATEVAAALAAYQANGIAFSTDWVGNNPNTSVGTYAFGPSDISTEDCFHPSLLGQAKLACDAWESWEGSGDARTCWQ
jgi:lysophospholipase L1-like esterase